MSAFVLNFFSLERSPLAIRGQWLTRVRSAKAVQAFAVAPNVEGKEVQNKGEALRNLQKNPSSGKLLNAARIIFDETGEQVFFSELSYSPSFLEKNDVTTVINLKFEGLVKTGSKEELSVKSVQTIHEDCSMVVGSKRDVTETAHKGKPSKIRHFSTAEEGLRAMLREK